MCYFVNYMGGRANRYVCCLFGQGEWIEALAIVIQHAVCRGVVCKYLENVGYLFSTFADGLAVLGAYTSWDLPVYDGKR